MKAFPFPEGIYTAGTLCVRAWRQPCEKWIMEENCATTVLRVAADIPDRLLECGAGGGGGRVTSRKWHWPRDWARLFSDIYKSILRMRHFSVLGIPGYGTAEKLKFRLTLRVRRNLRKLSPAHLSNWNYYIGQLKVGHHVTRSFFHLKSYTFYT